MPKQGASCKCGVDWARTGPLALTQSIADQAIMDRDGWQRHLVEEEARQGFSKGFKFLYGPWETREGAEVAFLSLNPGRAPAMADIRTVSDERGNSYAVEATTGVSPLTQQFLAFAARIGSPPEAILTGVAAPFRTDNWGSTSLAQRQAMLSLGRLFWREPMAGRRLRLVVAISNEAAALAVELTGAKAMSEHPAGWGNLMIRRYQLPNGGSVVHLPHLSRFRLFGREQSGTALDWALGPPVPARLATIANSLADREQTVANSGNNSFAVEYPQEEAHLPVTERSMLKRIRCSDGYSVEVLKLQSAVWLDGAKVGGLNRHLVEWYVSKLFVASHGGSQPLERRGFKRIDKAGHIYWAAKGTEVAEAFAAAITEMTSRPIRT